MNNRFRARGDRRDSRLGGAGFLALAVGVAIFAAGAAAAQETKLQTADEVLGKAIDALGGRAAFEKIHNRVMKGSIDVAGQPDKISLTVYEAEPNKQYSLTEVPGQGKIERGCDGKVCWQVSPMGPSVSEGIQRAQSLRQATFNDLLHLKELYQKVECVALEPVDDRPCYKLVMTPPEGAGNPETTYYDSKTYLPAKTVLTVQSPMGEVTIESVPGDFKKVDGVLLPTKLSQTQKIGPMNQLATLSFDKIEQNVDLPADRFALPPAVQELLQKPKAETQPTTKPAASGPGAKEKP